MLSTFCPPQPSLPGQSLSIRNPLGTSFVSGLTVSPSGVVTERFTSASAASHAISNWSGPVRDPHPSSMTPLQLSSTALKHRSGPVGVHASTSVDPGGALRFLASTCAAGGALAGAAGVQAQN